MKRPLDLLALLLLAAGGWYAYAAYSIGGERFTRSVEQLNEATALADQIALLRNKPDRVAAKSHSDRALAEAIELAAGAAGVEPRRIVRIEPSAPRRAGDADYLEHATSLQLDGVTLAQLATTLAELHSGKEGLEQLRVSAVRISAPYQASASEDGNERWNVELTLTYYVYSPKTPAAVKPRAESRERRA